MKPFLLLLVTISLWANRGLPARNSAADYSGHGESGGVTVAAESMDADQIKGTFATDLTDYAVLEVAIYPRKDGTQLDLQTMDFALRVDGRMVRPADPRSIAGILQRRAQGRSRDIVLYPTVGMTTGSWGTGTMAGVGVGMGGGAPGPASTDADRRVMENELDDRLLQDALITRPVAGYLYFPVPAGKRRGGTWVLEYDSGATQVKLSLPAPRTK